MSNSVSGNSNSNNEISINDLQKKLVNIEGTSFENSSLKSIFNAYNTERSAKNKTEVLSRAELQQFVNDIKKYDRQGNKNGIIDIDEAEMFVQDFNSKHTDKQIKVDDVFNFVRRIFKRYEYFNENTSSELMKENLAVGEPLSQKTIQLRGLVDGKIRTISVSIKLHATNHKKYVHQYLFNVQSGEEYADAIAKEFGYDDINAFISASLSKPDSQSYDINFSPNYKNTKATDTVGGESNVGFFVGKAENVDEDIIIVPHDLSRDPRITFEEYNKPEVQKTINEFIAYLEETIISAENNLDDVLAQEGITGWIADVVSHIWNNKYSIANTGNTESQMKEMLVEAKAMLEKFKNEQDNSLEGIVLHKDFGAYFKEFTNGIEFDYRKVRNFLDEQEGYIRKQSVLSMYHYVNDYMFDVVKKYEKYYNSNKYYEQHPEIKPDPLSPIPCGTTNSAVGNYYTMKQNYSTACTEMYNIFHNFLNISREEFDGMIQELEKNGQNPAIYVRTFANIIKTATEKETMSVLGLSSLNKINEYEEQVQKNYNYVKSDAIGRKGDLLRRIDDYHSSQIIGSAVVSGIIQIALYSGGLAVLGSALSLSAGVASGLSYSGSYLAVEVVDRLTNGIDNREDLYSYDAILELTSNAGVEYAAGHLFDGILKARLFSAVEKKALDCEKSLTEVVVTPEKLDEIGLSAVTKANTRFDANKLIEIMGVRGVAAGIGGTKDGTKEIFKETLKRKYSISDISAAFIIGAISNAFFIRFKNADFAKKDHRIIGKFFEKSPKKVIKNDLKYSEEVLDKKEQLYFENLLIDIRTHIINEIRQNIDKSGSKESLEFINNNEDAINKIILDQYFLEYLL